MNWLLGQVEAVAGAREVSIDRAGPLCDPTQRNALVVQRNERAGDRYGTTNTWLRSCTWVVCAASQPRVATVSYQTALIASSVGRGTAT